MKSKAIILLMMVLIVLIVNMGFQTATTSAAVNDVKIPDEAIRLRILANSNSEQDQRTKRKVRDAVNAEIATWVDGLETIEQARRVIRSHLPEIKQTVAKTLKTHGVKQTFDVKFGDVQFPTKIYGNYVYPAGTYEALLITLGKGLGANWWCVLFPPLCFLDFENGDAVKSEGVSAAPAQNEAHGVEVKFFIVEWFTSLLDAIIDFFSGLFSS